MSQITTHIATKALAAITVHNRHALPAITNVLVQRTRVKALGYYSSLARRRTVCTWRHLHSKHICLAGCKESTHESNQKCHTIRQAKSHPCLYILLAQQTHSTWIRRRGAIGSAKDSNSFGSGFEPQRCLFLRRIVLVRQIHSTFPRLNIVQLLFNIRVNVSTQELHDKHHKCTRSI